MGALDQDFVARYARTPTQTTTKQAISLHENVRATLGDVDYASVLQGSYKNDTALADMNDVDVLVVHRNMKSNIDDYFPRDQDWSALFSAIERKLEGDPKYRGKWTRGDKCIRLATTVNVDIVPALHLGNPESDPVTVYSFAARKARKNWPRGHYDAAARKSGETNGAFKQAVRLYKRWARCRFGATKVAPSYYLECLIYSLPSTLFTGDLATDFLALGDAILKRHGRHLYGSFARPAGSAANLIDNDEWGGTRFGTFRETLEGSLPHARAALSEADPARAKAAWRLAFGGHEP